MADIKKVMEKLNSQKSKSAPANIPAPMKKKVLPKVEPEPEEDLEEMEDEDQEDTEDQESADDQQEEEVEQEATEGKDQTEVINREIERLQNDGVFRAELLYQLIEINTHLKVLNTLIMKAIGGEDAAK